MTAWVSIRSEDACEWMLTGAENIDNDPSLLKDADGNPMVIVQRFEAPTWDDAKVVHERLMAEVREELGMNIRTEQELADYIISQLNEISETDPTAMEWLVDNRITCNKALADHPTVQVHARDGIPPTVGMLGILNGIVGVIGEGERLAGFGLIAAVYDGDNNFVGFRRTDDPEVKPEG